MMSAVSNLYDYTIGGYPEELFIGMREEEKKLLECSICYLVSRDPRECTSGHLFCTSCIVAWATGDADGSGKCPVCRVAGRYYRPSAKAHYLLARQMVQCPETPCQWVGYFREYKYHKKDCHLNTYLQIEKKVPIELFLKSKIYGRKTLDEEEVGELEGRVGDAGEETGERVAQESLEQVESIRGQLSKVSKDLSQLLVRMNKDHEKYMSYINDRVSRSVTGGFQERGQQPPSWMNSAATTCTSRKLKERSTTEQGKGKKNQTAGRNKTKTRRNINNQF